jgi:Tfp pilus assembly protein PilE
MVELMITSVLVVVFMYGAGTAYLNYFANEKRGEAKIRVQEDASQASEAMIRACRAADSVAVTGSGNGFQVATFPTSGSVTATHLFSISTSGAYKYLQDNAVQLVPSPLASLSASVSGKMVQVTLKMADTTGDTVTTMAAANMRN